MQHSTFRHRWAPPLALASSQPKQSVVFTGTCHILICLASQHSRPSHKAHTWCCLSRMSHMLSTLNYQQEAAGDFAGSCGILPRSGPLHSAYRVRRTGRSCNCSGVLGFHLASLVRWSSWLAPSWILGRASQVALTARGNPCCFVWNSSFVVRCRKPFRRKISLWICQRSTLGAKSSNTRTTWLGSHTFALVRCIFGTKVRLRFLTQVL